MSLHPEEIYRKSIAECREHLNRRILVDIANTQSESVEPDDVPNEIESITRGLVEEYPPTNPLVVLKAVRWWYIHGKSESDPAFR